MIVEEFYLIAIAAVVAAECALIGTVLCLRKMVLLGDAISHAILPGVVFAFAVTGAIVSPLTLLGAMAFAVLTVALIERLSVTRRIEEQAATGVVFTFLFAIGVLGVSYYRSADLDLDCVLFGNLELAPFDLIRVGSTNLGPRALWTNGLLLVANAAVVALLFKELKISAFDPEYAQTQGFRPRVLFYVSAVLAALTCVAAFEAVGVILVVAMLAVPAGAALLWCSHMHSALFVAVLHGVISGVVAYPLAYTVDCSVAGAAALIAGALFLVAFLFAPQRGVFARWLAARHRRLHLQALLVLMHLPEPGKGMERSTLCRLLNLAETEIEPVIEFLATHGYVRLDGTQIVLTHEGRRWCHSAGTDSNGDVPS